MATDELMRSRPFSLAILDWSGVLVDELGVLADLHAANIRELSGSTITTAEWQSRVSQRWTDLYLQEGVSTERLGDAAERFKQRFRINARQVKALPGAEAFLALLKRMGITTVILSNQFEDSVQQVLAQLGWREYVDEVVAATRLDAPKSRPDALWGILRRHGGAPRDAFLVDDMDGGIALAKTAGVMAVGCRSPLSHLLQDADLVVDDLDELGRRLLAGDLPRARMTPPQYRSYYEEREAAKSRGDIARLPAFYHAENDALVRFVAATTPLPREAIVVDAGCGSARHSARLRDDFRARCAVRLDLALSALRRGSSADGVYPVQADVAALPVRSGAADVVLCLETVEHVVDPVAVVTELARVAKPGAVVVVAAPNSMAVTHPLLRGLQRRSHGAGHMREYTVESLTELVRAAGAQPVWAGTRWFLAYWLAFAIERGRLCRPVGRLFAQVPPLGRFFASFVGRAVYWETQLFGHRSRRGLGVLVIARVPAKRK